MISILLCLCASFIYPNCEKSSLDMMELFYNESICLGGVSSDSIKAFSNKVSDYVTAYPKEKNNPFYSKIQNNINTISISFTLTIDTVWGDTIYYDF